MKFFYLNILLLLILFFSTINPQKVYAQDCGITSCGACDGCSFTCCDACGCHPGGGGAECGPNCPGGPAAPAAPAVAGYLKDYLGRPVANTEIRWTDSLSPTHNIRKRWTNASGYYNFASWQNLPGMNDQQQSDFRRAEYGSYPGSPWISNTYQYEAYSSAQNPHTFTGIALGAQQFGAMISRSGINLATTPDPLPMDLVYKPPPIGYPTGPTSGFVGVQAGPFYSYGEGWGMTLTRIYYASTTTSNANLALGSSWTLLGETACNSTYNWCYSANYYWTPPATGSYYIATNAFSSNPPNTWCSGNPIIDWGLYTQAASCTGVFGGVSHSSWYVFTASPCPAAVACPTACGSPASNQPNGACGTYYCAAPTVPPAQLCPATCHTTDVGVSNGSCGTTNCPANCPSAPTISTLPACINTGDTGGNIGFSWGVVTPPVNTIDLSTDPNFGTWSWKSVVGLNSTNATGFTGSLTFNPNTTYYVRSWNGLFHSGNANFSRSVCTAGSATTLTASCPSPGTSATLSWTPANYATYYKIQLNGPSPDFTPPPGMNPVTITRTTTSSTPYNWSVQACNADNCGATISGPSFTCGASAWFKTTGGDIHSNVEINAPSGP